MVIQLSGIIAFMRVAIVYNPRPENIDRDDPALEQFIEGDEWKTIKAIGKAVAANGHTIKYVAVDENIFIKLKKLKGKIDLIFNLSEGVSGTSDREAQLPMFAEILKIPHTGPTPLSAALILNKFRAKQIWSAVGIPVAAGQLFTSNSQKLDTGLNFPLIVKPNTEGSGIGIHKKSIVRNPSQLKKMVNIVNSKYHQDALVEEYLPGREFTVSIVGNGDGLTVLPIIEINFAIFPKDSLPIDSYEAKFVYGLTGIVPMHKTEFCPADIPTKLEKEIINISKDAYNAIGCLDFGRLDIRLDSKGKPKVLEINSPPGLMSDPKESSFFTISARAAGWDFTTLIGKILLAAQKRLF